MNQSGVSCDSYCGLHYGVQLALFTSITDFQERRVWYTLAFPIVLVTTDNLHPLQSSSHGTAPMLLYTVVVPVRVVVTVNLVTHLVGAGGAAMATLNRTC